MVDTEAYLVDHVFPWLPMRQWVLPLPKRLHNFLRHERRAVMAILGIFLRVVEKRLMPRAASSQSA